MTEKEKIIAQRRKKRKITIEIKRGDLDELNKEDDMDDISKGIHKDINNNMNDLTDEDGYEI